VENVVFVKTTSSTAEPFDTETLQTQVLAWLERTGNGMPHSTIRKIPLQQCIARKEHLTPWVSVKLLPAYITRYVRSTIPLYAGNFGLCHKEHIKDACVMVWLKAGEPHIHDDRANFLCVKHPVPQNKGNKIINTSITSVIRPRN
jgi:hypothetical protein